MPLQMSAQREYEQMTKGIRAKGTWTRARNSEGVKLDYFDKRMALDVVEDALRDLDTPNSRGMATGLCGALYMCGLLTDKEWNAFLERIPPEHDRPRPD